MSPEFWASILGLTIGTVLVVMLHMLTKLSDGVSSLRCKLDLLMKHSGMNVRELAALEVQTMLRNGPTFDKIAAIKRFRELTGASLVEAKTAVERIQGDARPA